MTPEEIAGAFGGLNAKVDGLTVLMNNHLQHHQGIEIAMVVFILGLFGILIRTLLMNGGKK